MSQHVPNDDGIFLDHLAHWVPDLEAAGAILQRMGFTLTPRTEHTHSPAPGAPIEPAGSANQCIMLDSGYLEILTPTAQTPVGLELRRGIERYTGVHLAALCVADAAAERERLVAAGFPQRPTVSLERATLDADGVPATLRFTVIRPEPGTLAEGRVQFLTHRTPQLLWLPGLVRHANGARGLTDMLFCVADPEEAAQRYARYLRTPATPVASGARLDLDRGSLTVLGPDACRRVLGIDPPDIPSMAAYALRCANLDTTCAYLRDAGFDTASGPGTSRLLHLPADLGASIALHEGSGVRWS